MICQFCQKREVKLKWTGKEHDVYECPLCCMKYTVYKTQEPKL